MYRLCIVPARGGSTRFPKKNISLLDDKPLIFHTLDIIDGLFDQIIFTSDCDIMLDMVCERYANVETSSRPEELASNTSRVIDTVNYYHDNTTCHLDQIWLCLPTCPLRMEKDVINAQKLLTGDVDSVISITDYEFPPTLGLTRDGEDMIFDWHDSNPWQNNNHRSQDHPAIYRPNGAIYGSWSGAFTEHRNFYKGRVKGYFMPRERSIDIDNRIDLKMAQIILKDTNADQKRI